MVWSDAIKTQIWFRWPPVNLGKTKKCWITCATKNICKVNVQFKQIFHTGNHLYDEQQSKTQLCGREVHNFL